MGVAGRGEAADYTSFVDRGGIADLTHLIDEDGSLWQSFNVASQPSWAFLDADGNVLTSMNRALGADGLRERIAELY